MFRRERRTVPELNTTSTADISFMLLILFLVTTSMDIDKGLVRLLPPLSPPQELQEEVDVAARNVMKIHIKSNNQITIDGQNVPTSHLRQRIALFVDNPYNRPDLPEKHTKDIPLLGKCSVADKHVIQLIAEREASYDTYFQVQNEIVAAYNQLRDKLAVARFGRPYTQCSNKEKEALTKHYPQRISEMYNTEEEGGKP